MATKTKGNTLNIANVQVDGIAGIKFEGFIPYADFSAEKDGNKYTVYIDPESGKTVPEGTAGAVADDRQATAHRDFRKSITNPEVVWPDGKIRTLSIRLKANDPMTPAEYQADKAEGVVNRVQAATAKMTPDAKRELLAKLTAELEAEDAAE